VRTLTKSSWKTEVLNAEGQDSLIMFFTSEVVNFSQRLIAFQVNLVAQELKKHGYLPTKVQIFAYDTNTEGFPAGVSPGAAPPEDYTGAKQRSEEM